MRIKFNTYLSIYKKLLEKIVKEEYNNNPSIKPTSIKIWNVQKKINGKNINVIADKFDLGKDYSYFYRLYKKASDRPEKIPIIDIRLYKVLKELGYKLNGSLRSKHISTKSDEYDFALNLLEQFEKENELSQLAIIDSGVSKYELDESRYFYKEFTIEKVEHILKVFFTNILSKKIYQAWNMLTPQFQYSGVWKGNYDKFKAGMLMIKDISDLAAYNLVYNYDGVYFNCSYKEILLSFPDNINVDSIDSLIKAGLLSTEAMRRIHKKENKSRTILNISEKCDDPANERYKWFNSGISTEQLLEKYPKAKTEVKNRIYNSSITMFENEFKISSLSPKITLIDFE